MTRFATILVAALVLVPHVRADNIFVKGKPPITGVQILSENAKEIEYSKGGKKMKIDSWSVSGVAYEKQSRNFRKGVELFSTEDYANAATQLATAADEPNQETAWVKEYAPYYLGRCYMATGQFDKAVEAFKKTLAVKSNSRLVGDVTIGLTRAYVGAKNFAMAKSAAEGLKKLVADQQVPGFWHVEADMVLAEALIAEKQFDKAAALMQEVALSVQPGDDKKEPEKAEYFVRVKVMQATALIEAKDMTRARTIFSELAARGATGNIVAQAAGRNGLAELDILDGKDLDRAALNLARAKVENFGAVSEMSRTCYLLGLVHLKMTGTVEGAKDIAKSYFAETIERYPESREAVLAREQMKQL